MALEYRTYRYPKSWPPGVNLNTNLWLKMEAMTLPKENRSANARAPIIATPTGRSFELMVPSSFQLGMSHQWESYDNMLSKLAEKAGKYYKNAKTITGLAGAGWNALVGDPKFRTILEGEPLISTRIDSPLVYKTSSPIEYNLAFEFVVYGEGDADYLQEIITELLKLSSPKKDANDNIPLFIDQPNVFKVYTITGQGSKSPILYISLAALTSIQPNWKAPYVNGRAMAVDLTLTLRDITPLFDVNFTTGSSITTSSNRIV